MNANKKLVLIFCKSHDWGNYSYFDGETLVVITVDKVERFSTVNDLLQWAGY